MWSSDVREKALVACGRRCCICHCFCGRNIELHHIKAEAGGGKSTFENCIPLCFNCHAEAGHYNREHPKGTKYSPQELKGHRDRWYEAIRQLSYLEDAKGICKNIYPDEVYEGQEVTLTGFVWREAFPGRPNYESFETDEREVYWMLVLPSAVTLLACSLEDESTIRINNVKKLQLLVEHEFYGDNRDIVLTNISATGKLYMSMTGHHHGDALFKLIHLEKN